MKRLLIFIASFIAIAFTLSVVAVLYLVNLDPNQHKDKIADLFLEETGRSLNLDGDIKLNIYPWLELEIEQLTIGNAAGFNEIPLVSINKALVRIKFAPLFSQHYEVDTLELDGIHFNLAINAAGQTNWSDLFQEASSPDSATPLDIEANNISNISLSKINLRNIDIRNASLTFDDRSADQHIELENFTAHLGKLVYGQPIDLNMHFDLSAKRPNLATQTDFSGTLIYDLNTQHYQLTPLSLQTLITGPNIPNGSTSLSLTSDLNINLSEGTFSLSDIELDALGTHLSANLIGRGMQTDAPAYDAEVNLRGNNLAQLFRIAEINELATQIEKIDSGEFNFTAAINADLQADNITLTKLNANLLGAEISGNLNISHLQADTPNLSGQLNAEGPDLPTLLGVTSLLLGGSDSALSAYSRQLRTISDKSFALNTHFSTDLESGNIDMPILNADLLGFNIDAQLSAKNMSDSSGTLTGKLSLSNNNLGEFLAALGQNEVAAIAKTINLSLAVEGNRNSLEISPVTLKLSLAGPQIQNSPAALELRATSSLSLENNSLRVSEFAINGLGLNTNGNLSLNNIHDKPNFNGTVNIAPFNLRQFLTQLKQELPQTSDLSTLQNISLGASFNGSAFSGSAFSGSALNGPVSQLQLNNFTLMLDDSAIDGSVTITDLANPAIEFAIKVDQINADRYRPPVNEGASGPATSSEELPIKTLQALKLKGELNIGQLTISGLNIAEVVMALNADEGKIKLSPVQASLYQGTYAGSLSLDVSTGIPSANINSSLQNVELKPLMTDFINDSYISGTGNIAFDISGHGSDIALIKRNLNGSGNLAVHDGVLQGVDVGEVLTQVETMIQRGKLSGLNRGNETPFDHFSASFTINKGLVNSNDLLIEAPGFQVEGQGTLVNLNNNTINYHLLTSVDASTATRNSEVYDIGGYSLPIACTGSINSPSCLPDAGEILAIAIRQRLGGLLQQALGVDENNDDENNLSAEEENQEEAAAVPQDLKEQLLNRALESIFR